MWIAAACGGLLVAVGAGVGIGAAVWSGGDEAVASAPAPRSSGQTSSGAPPDSTARQYGPFQGTVGPAAGFAFRKTVTCPDDRPYVLAADGNNGTIWDEPYLETAGTDDRISVGKSAYDSVAWGHPGSRLATAIYLAADSPRDPVSGQIEYPKANLAYKVSAYCTGNKSKAWVILG
jgi:hypothetical protein